MIKKWQIRAKHTLLFCTWLEIDFERQDLKLSTAANRNKKKANLITTVYGSFIQPPKFTLIYSSINSLCCLLLALAEQTSRAAPSICPVAQNRKHFGTLYSWGEMGRGRKSMGKKERRKKEI